MTRCRGKGIRDDGFAPLALPGRAGVALSAPVIPLPLVILPLYVISMCDCYVIPSVAEESRRFGVDSLQGSRFLGYARNDMGDGVMGMMALRSE